MTPTPKMQTGFPMLKLIRSLMPKEERFIDFFTAHAQCMVEASKALTAMLNAKESEVESAFVHIKTAETKADGVGRQTIVALHRAFITPFDRSDIHLLTTALDDTIDLIEDVGQHTLLYKVQFDDHMRALAAVIEEGALALSELMPLLSSINKSAKDINALCQKIGSLESKADKILRTAMSELIAERPDTISFIGRKDMYELLEAVTDRIDDVSDQIEGIVLDHV